MAKTLGKNPWIFTASGDAEGLGQGGTYDHPIFVDHFVLDTGDADSDFIILDESGGQKIVDIDGPVADDSVWWDVNGFLKSFYVDTIPTNGVLYVYLGNPR